jgi:hypothetical protein
MSIDYTILVICSCGGQFVLASGRNPFVISTIINAALNLTLIVIFCIKYGLIGFPLSTLISGLLVITGTTHIMGGSCGVNLIKSQSNCNKFNAYVLIYKRQLL